MKTEYKVSIITGLIASALFVWLIEPTINFFGHSVFELISHISSAYIDHLYSRAALGSTDDASFSLFLGAAGIMWGVIWGVASAILRQKKNSDIKESKTKSPWLKRSVVLILIVLSIASSLVTWCVCFELSTVTSFKQHMAIVSPYLTDQETKVFFSRWAQMQSRRDYDSIYTDLKRIAVANNVKLPQNPVYSMTSF